MANFENGESSGLNGSDPDCDIPPGFRFSPTEEELLHYLEAKLRNPSQYYSHIPEVDIYASSPMELAVRYKIGEEKEGYFFARRNKRYSQGSRAARSTQSRRWKPSTGKPVTNVEGKSIGFVRTLKYGHGSSSNKAAEWLMQEFSPGADPKRFYDWVAVKIYKKRGAKNDNSTAEIVLQTNYALQSENHPALMGTSPDQLLQIQEQYSPHFMDQSQSLPWTQASQMDPCLDQQLQLEPHYQQQSLDQAQSFLQVPEPIQEVAQSTSINWFSAQVGSSKDQYYSLKTQSLQRHMPQPQQPVSWTPEPIQFFQGHMPQAQQLVSWTPELIQVSTTPDFDTYGNCAIIPQPQLQTCVLQESSAAAPQHQGGQLPGDKSCLNTDLQFNGYDSDYNF